MAEDGACARSGAKLACFIMSKPSTPACGAHVVYKREDLVLLTGPEIHECKEEYGKAPISMDASQDNSCVIQATPYSGGRGLLTSPVMPPGRKEQHLGCKGAANWPLASRRFECWSDRISPPIFRHQKSTLENLPFYFLGGTASIVQDGETCGRGGIGPLLITTPHHLLYTQLSRITLNFHLSA